MKTIKLPHRYATWLALWKDTQHLFVDGVEELAITEVPKQQFLLYEGAYAKVSEVLRLSRKDILLRVLQEKLEKKSGKELETIYNLIRL